MKSSVKNTLKDFYRKHEFGVKLGLFSGAVLSAAAVGGYAVHDDASYYIKKGLEICYDCWIRREPSYRLPYNF